MYQSSSYVVGLETNKNYLMECILNIEEPTFFHLGLQTIMEKKNILLLGGLDHRTGDKS